MVGGHHNVGGLIQAQAIERGSEPGQIARRIADSRQTRRAVDAGAQLIEAIALVMLGAIRIARPEHQNKRLIRRLEAREDHIRGDPSEPVLLIDIGHMHARHIVGARIAVQPPVRRDDRQSQGLDGLRDIRRQGNAVGLRQAGGIVDHDGSLPIPLRYILD